MPAPKKYPEEMRERSVRLVLDLVDGDEQASVTGACSRVGAQLGINRDTLRGWVKQAQIDAGSRAGTTTSERERIRALERENAELRRANAILKTASLDSTGQRNSAASLPAGVSKFNVLRGRVFSR